MKPEQIKLPAVEIISVNRTEHGICVDAACGKTAALVCIFEDYVQVVVNNASHRSWRGGGKSFDTIAEAVGNYRTPAMKAIILAADKFNA